MGPETAALILCTRELHRCGRYDLAVQVGRLAVAEQERIGQAGAEPEAAADAHTLVADSLDELGRWKEGLHHWQHAADLRPDAPLARFNLAIALLRLENFAPGFSLHETRAARPDWTCRGLGVSGHALYEARIDKPDWTGFSALPSRAIARARVLKPGDPVAGRTILVLTEQGLGDCIMFARYVPLLAARGARVLLACSPPLHDVFAAIPGIAEVLSPPLAQPMAKLNLSALAFDAWVPLLSLPLHIGDGTDAPLAGVPYLRTDPARRAQWRNRYDAKGRAGAPKVGLVWRANPASPNVAKRSLRSDELAPLLGMSGIDWIVLHPAADARALDDGCRNVIDPELAGAGLNDFAAAIAATDLLVTVDTMAAHCAGAIGHPAWVMVPRNPHWYWGTGGVDTRWYPTLKLFRQDAPHDWSNAVSGVAAQVRVRFKDQL